MKKTKLYLLRWGVLLLGILLLAAGVYREEYRLVMQKAVRICLECIGIG